MVRVDREGELVSARIRLLPALALGCRNSCATCGCRAGVEGCTPAVRAVAEAPGPQGCGGDVELFAGRNGGGVRLLGGVVGAMVLLSTEGRVMPLAGACSCTFRLPVCRAAASQTSQ